MGGLCARQAGAAPIMAVGVALIWSLLPAVAASAGAPSTDRPFTVSDLLKIEQLGPAAITSDHTQLVAQIEGAAETAGRFDSDGFATPYTGRIRVAALSAPYQTFDIRHPDAGLGLVGGPVSPDGRQILLQGFREGRWASALGDLRDGSLSWIELAIDLPVLGRSAQWTSPETFVAISLPPGAAPAYVEAIPLPKRRLGELWEQAASGRESYRLVGVGPGLASWPSPRPGGLVQVDAMRGAVRPLAEGVFLDIEASPNGRWVAALEASEVVQPDVTERIDVASRGRRHALVVVDLRTGASWRPLPGMDVLPLKLSWSPSGAQLMVLAQAPDKAPNLWVITPDTRTLRTADLGATTLATDRLGAGFLIAKTAWLGESPVVGVRRPERDGVSWVEIGQAGLRDLSQGFPKAATDIIAADGETITFIGPDGLILVNVDGDLLVPAGPRLRPINPPRLGEGLRFEITPSASVPLLQGPSHVHRLTQGHLVRAAATPPQASIVVASSAIVTRARDARGVSTIALSAEGRFVPLFSLNQHLATTIPMEVHPVAHHGEGGRRLTSWYLSPAGRKASEATPLIVLPYPGASYPSPPPSLRADAWAPTPHARLLSAAGYGVLIPALPTRSTAGEPAQHITSQLEAAVDAALGKNLADPQRVALWGHSFGGYGALIAASQSDRFRAVVAQAAKTDLTAGWGALTPFGRLAPETGPAMLSSIGWTESGQGGLGAPPWAAPERYQRNSPLFRADAIETPVLLIHGDHDFVPLPQAEALFAALYRQGKPAALMTLFGEGHLPSSPANIKAIYDVVLEWLQAQGMAAERVHICPSSHAGQPASCPSL